MKSSGQFPRQLPGQSIATEIDVMGWRTVGASLILASLLLMSGQLTILFSPFLTLVHELGHTCLAWLFGYFAIPAFDFIYGGGMTLQSETRVGLIMLAIYGGFGFLFYRYRRNDLTSRLLLAAVMLYCLCAYTAVHKLLMIAMGHGFELIFAGIFLYRALSGAACRYSIERPLYGMMGLFTILYDVRFAFRLLVDREVRTIYQLGKGEILDHDLVRLSNAFLGVDVSIVALFFLLCCIVTPVLIFLLFRYQTLMLFLFQRLFLETDDGKLTR